MVENQTKTKTKQTAPPTKKGGFFQKRIPTLVGLGVLIIALVAGTILFSQGTGVFAPRATPQTTPKKIKITNITDSSFTVSFLTDEATTGQVIYGQSENKLNTNARDDRDQLSGSVGEYRTHHVTVRGLEASTNYFFVLGTGSGSFDNNGQAFKTKTTQASGVPSAAKTIYGSVTNPAGSPAEGAIVYIKTNGVGEMSSIVKSSGSWAIPLSNARKADGSGYAQVQDQDVLTVFAQGPANDLTSQVTVQVSDAQPVPSITLGESQDLASAGSNQAQSNQTASSPSPSPSPSITPSPSPDQDLIDEESATSSSGLNNLATSTEDEATSSAGADDQVVDLKLSEETATDPTVKTSQPKITGQAGPNVVVNIQVNSETQLEHSLTADEDGNFELDLAQLGADLEPGEHTVTYSYNDPETGDEISKTQTFYVEADDDTSNLLASAETEEDEEDEQDYPYSSASPYPGEATESAESTESAQVSMPSTQSAVPTSGSVETTYVLVFGGLFFILAGVWSFWLASHFEVLELE